MEDSPKTLPRVAAVGSLVVILAFGLVFYSFYTAHQNGCDARNTSLNVLRDVIVIASTPDRHQKITSQQISRIAAFRAATFARIDQARC
jgi:hypothetical protein